MTLGEGAELYCGIELPLFLGCGFVLEFAVAFLCLCRGIFAEFAGGIFCVCVVGFSLRGL